MRKGTNNTKKAAVLGLWLPSQDSMHLFSSLQGMGPSGPDAGAPGLSYVNTSKEFEDPKDQK